MKYFIVEGFARGENIKEVLAKAEEMEDGRKAILRIIMLDDLADLALLGRAKINGSSLVYEEISHGEILREEYLGELVDLFLVHKIGDILRIYPEDPR